MSGRPNVVWMTLDSVREDHTSMAGYERDTTPSLQRIADEGGVAFRNAFAHSNWTLASSAAILTGTHPSHNTVGITGNTLPGEVPTVAERFRDAGYRTACLSRNSHISDPTGLSRGFERFEWLAASTIRQATGIVRAAGIRSLAKYLWNVRTHSAGFTTDTAKHSTPYLVNEVAKGWLDDLTAGQDPFFFYLHYNEPHRPYYPPRSYLDAFTDEIDASPAEAADVAMDIHENLYEILADGCDLSARRMEALLAMYDAEIAYTDRCIGALYDHVNEATDDETIFVVTADHGELFGEHELLSHKFVLDDAVTNVPLVVDWIDGEHNGLRAGPTDVVSHVDLVRTIASVAGVETSGLQGVDLREDVPGFAVSQCRNDDPDERLSRSDSFDHSRFHSGLLTSFRDDSWRYQTSDSGSGLLVPPDGTADVSAEHPEEFERWESAAEAWLDDEGRPVSRGRDAEFTEAMRQQLADLGYVD